MNRWCRSFVVRVVAASIAVIVSACDDRRDVRFVAESDSYMGSHHVRIKPGSRYVRMETRGSSTNKTHVFACAEIRVVIDSADELTVNGTPFGKLEFGQHVLIEKGRVFIDGQPVSPQLREKLEGTSGPEADETRTRLGGHTIRVRPGSKMITRLSGLTEHTIRIGDVTITIEEGILIVNDVRYGTLAERDTILVDNHAVYVSGEPRTPQ